jgi:hypothetical protein
MLAGRSGRWPQRVRAPNGDGRPTQPAAWPSRRLVHVWSTPHRSPAVRNGLQRYLVRQVAGSILGQ